MPDPTPDTVPGIPELLLASLQEGFPIEDRPFAVIGEKAGLTERQVIDRIQQLKDEGIIRVFGPVFEARRLGYVSTLAALKIDADRVPEIATAMLGFPEITHNYLREHEWNLWFTITARNRDTLDHTLKWAQKFAGVRGAMNLPATRLFKVNAVWGIDGSVRAQRGPTDEEPLEFDERTRAMVRALQQDFPIVEHPFRLIAGKLGRPQEEVLAAVREWIDDGTIRRFGARLNHRRIGFGWNMLTAWSGGNLERWGEMFAAIDRVSHVVLRETSPGWPFGLYAMVHAASENELRRLLSSMKRIAMGGNMVRLRTLYELKKTSMKYFTEE